MPKAAGDRDPRAGTPFPLPPVPGFADGEQKRVPSGWCKKGQLRGDLRAAPIGEEPVMCVTVQTIRSWQMRQSTGRISHTTKAFMHGRVGPPFPSPDDRKRRFDKRVKHWQILGVSGTLVHGTERRI